MILLTSEQELFAQIVCYQHITLKHAQPSKFITIILGL